MTDIAFRPAGELIAAIRNREVSSRELLDHLLERVERLNPRINAVITLDVERARERADAADAALARGESWGPLHGLPITVKDCFETAGLRTTCGAPQLADHVPERNAIAVERLLAAGAVSEEQFDALVGAGQAAVAGNPGEIAAFARAVGMRHREWLAAHQEREQMRAGWADFFREVDVLLCPAAPLPAIPHDHREPLILRTLEVNGETRPYTDYFAWTGPFGAAHLPASVAPAGRTPDGLPVGIQIVAAHLEDRTSIDFARRLADQIGGFEPPPGFGADPRPARRRQLG